jgi:hypothetical protein
VSGLGGLAPISFALSAVVRFAGRAKKEEHRQGASGRRLRRLTIAFCHRSGAHGRDREVTKVE